MHSTVPQRRRFRALPKLLETDENTSSRVFFLLTVAACGMAVLLALLPAAGHDQLWLLYAARLSLQGAPFYGPQIFETNPPLILWLSLLPAALAHLTHLPDTTIGKFLLCLLLFAVAALCLFLLRLLRPFADAPLWPLTFVFVVAFAVIPARDFGQRDHLLILFLLPYIFAAALRATGHPLSPALASLVGILALLGLALKPHHLLVPAAAESYLLLLRVKRTGLRRPFRSLFRGLLRPEILAMFASGCAFLAAVHLFAPLYLASVVPLARDTYWAYGRLTLPQLVSQSVQLHLLGLLDLALLLKLRWRDTPDLTRLLLLGGLASTFAFYLQGTGWYYQQLPALTFFLFALAFLLFDLCKSTEIRVPPWTTAAAAALSVLALALTAHAMHYPFNADRSFPLDNPDPAFFAGLPPGTPVMTLSPSVDDTIMPIAKFHLILGQRYSSFVMLPAILRSENPQGEHLSHTISPARLAQIDELQHAYMREDLLRWQPRLILVERCQDPAVHCQVLEDRHDNLLNFFLTDPGFARIFARYRFSRTSGAYDAYLRN